MYDKSLDQFATNSYSWQKIYNRPFYVSQYFVNDGLKQFNYNKRLKYYGYKGVEIPEFNWFDGGITYRFRKSMVLLLNQWFFQANELLKLNLHQLLLQWQKQKC
jgi:hypothetical protein